MDVNGPKVIFVLPFLGGIPITETVIVSWGIIALIFVVIKILTFNMSKRNINTKQANFNLHL